MSQSEYDLGYEHGLSMFGHDAEVERRQRHHDVLCLVLKAARQADLFDEGMDEIVVRQARKIADLAYPTPKAEGT